MGIIYLGLAHGIGPDSGEGRIGKYKMVQGESREVRIIFPPTKWGFIALTTAILVFSLDCGKGFADTW